MEASDVMAVVGMLEEYMPVVKKAVPLVEEACGELAPLINKFTDFSVDMSVRAIKRYEAAGMSRDEAILLTINTKASLMESLQKMNKN